MLLLFVIQSFLKKPTMEEFIPSKAEKKLLAAAAFNIFGQFINTSWGLLLPSKRVQKNYHFPILINILAYLLIYCLHTLFMICI